MSANEIAELNRNSALENLQKFLNEPADEKQVKKLNGVNYLPIGYVESKLDSIYSGLWSIENIHTTIMLNSILVELELKVYNFIIGQWITRAGVGAVPVQLQKDKKVITPEDIQTFAIQKGAPAAKAFALKNAAQSLGVIFGRNINRTGDYEYLPLSEAVAEYEEQNSAITDIFNNIESITDLATLKNYWSEIKPFQNNKEVAKAFTARKNQLS